MNFGISLILPLDIDRAGDENRLHLSLKASTYFLVFSDLACGHIRVVSEILFVSLLLESTTLVLGGELGTGSSEDRTLDFAIESAYKKKSVK